MYIISDTGEETINAEQVFCFALSFMGRKNPGQPPSPVNPAAPVLAAQGGPWTSCLVMGHRERCERALVAIQEGLKQRRHILDLREVGGVGPRPNLDIEIAYQLPSNGDRR